MVNLLSFFEEHYLDTYYLQLKDFVKPKRYNYSYFGDIIGEENISYDMYDINEIIEKFKEICQPDRGYTDEDNSWYILISFYFWKNGYTLDQFPNIFERPKNIKSFAYDDIRQFAIKHGMVKNDGSVAWATRRQIINEFSFSFDNEKCINIDNVAEKLVMEIDTNSLKWNEMTLDTKLLNLNNTIEYLLKSKNNKFIDIPEIDHIQQLVLPTEFRKLTHLFRHGVAPHLRTEYSESEKQFLVDYGVSMVHLICRNLTDKHNI